MKEKKHKKIEGTMITVMILLLIIGITYAYFMISKSIDIGVVSAGTLSMKFTDGNETLELTNTPIYEEDIDTESDYITFSIENTGSINMYTNIYFKDIAMDSELKDYDFKWILEDITEEDIKIVNEGTFINIKDNKKVLANNLLIKPTEIKEYKVKIYVLETGLDQSIFDSKSFKGKIGATGYVREQGGEANDPSLSEGMIPVVYDEETDNWIKAGGDYVWYDYDNQMWANAVTVTKANRETYINAKPGTSISMNDINSMWVWIPRYKYKIPSNIGSSTDILNPPEIDIIFENGVQTTGASYEEYIAGLNGCIKDCTNKNYYTHTVFRDGSTEYNNEPYDIGGWDHELTGIWASKFRTGGSATLPIIKPDILSLYNTGVSNKFITSLIFSGGKIDKETGKVTFVGNDTYGLTNNVDTHMSKNTEWGAILYLYHSKYGKYGNKAFEKNDKQLYTDKSTGYKVYTGRSNGTSDTSSTSTETYSYNGYICDDSKCTSEGRNKDIILAGTGASTTGTIYGVYDMNDYYNDNVMANWNNYTGNTDCQSGFNGEYLDADGEKTDGIHFPDRKYYDLYTYTKANCRDGDVKPGKIILGDAVWETQRWYGNNTSISRCDMSWFKRRQTFGAVFSWVNGYADGSLGFRTILINN